MPATMKRTNKRTVERVYTCSVCTTEYTTTRYSKTHYCSPSCRSKARNNKTASRRIEKLPVSDSWLWVARECHRAGTVEILKDVDLEQLFEVYNRRFKCYGWDSENKTSKFHLCHIAPVSGKHSIGLLHHENLFIGGSLANQVHGTKEYEGVGKSIPRSSLLDKWRVGSKDSHRAILSKVQKYLGNKLVEYAKKNPIKKAQRFVLAERISKLKNNILPLDQLEKMGTQALMKLEAELLQKDVFSIKLIAKRSLVVYQEELERFSTYDTDKQSDYLFMSDAVRVVAQLLSQENESGLSSITAHKFRWYYEFTPLQLKPNKDLSKLRDFISFTAFSLLQGAELDKSLVKNTLNAYIDVVSLTVVEHGIPDFNDTFTDFEYIRDELNEFSENVEKVKNAISNASLLSPSVVLKLEEKAKEQSFLNTYRAETACPEYWNYDYSEYGIKVEAEYSLPVYSDTFLESLPF
ncbi:hypothetical protein [Aquipseudomonas alcaligenes]|uniref:Uncharacterized protein n=1 Tax=Aquipseudomonas alcaligenes TaxID=43263 RepID=A0A1N6WMS0_AQUAC|nr:hypothetical protein [Pseudomonas alcaligenes]SIQ91404.1 hypothetical protein SAMN05878282_11078 [Pseudomonas alcaligenes]